MEIHSTTQVVSSLHNEEKSENNKTTSQFKLSVNDKDSLDKATMLKKLSQKTNDDIFNKIIFNSSKDMDIDDIKILSTILDDSSSIDRFSGILLSPEKLSELSSSKYIISNDKLSLDSYKDSYEFINSTIEHLEQSYKNNKFNEHPDEAIVSEKFHKLFLDIENKYIDIIDDDKSILSEYTKTIKPLILEEAQEIEENQQLKMAMKIYGLDSGSSLQKFEYELIKEGYRRDEARDRASLYAQAGLLGHSDIEEKFGIVIHDLSMLGRTPELKEAMIESYAQMDTEQLREVISKVNSFPMNFEDFRNILGAEGQYTPEEIVKRADNYWENKYGKPEQIINHFFDKIAEVDKFPPINASNIKNGIQLLMDIFKEKINYN